MGQFYTTAGMIWLWARALEQLAVVQFQGDATAGSATIANVSSVAGLEPGMLVLDGTGNYLEVVGDLTSASAVITAVVSTAGVQAGLPIYGNGIIAGTTIVSHTSNTITMSNPAASTHAAAVLVTEGATAFAAGTTILAVGTTTITLSAPASGSGTSLVMNALGSGAQTLPISLHLLTGSIAQGATTLWSNLTEATFTGYAPVELTGTTFSVSSPQSGWVIASFGCLLFTPTDYLIPNTITGMAWTYPGAGASGPQLIASERFVNPVTLSVTGQVLQTIPVLSIPIDATAGPSSPIL